MNFLKHFFFVASIAVIFTACDKNEAIPSGDISSSFENSEPDGPMTRSFRSSTSYTVAQIYKDNYVHRKSDHGVAAGFFNWKNCIARAEGDDLINFVDVTDLGDGTAQNTITLQKFVDKYQVKLRTYPDEVEFKNYLTGSFNGGQPCAALIQRTYNGKLKNTLVVVFTYKDGVVYFRDPFNGSKGMTQVQSLALSDFFSSGQDASSAEVGVLNIIRW